MAFSQFSSQSSKKSVDILEPVKRRIENIPVENPQTAHRIVSLIPADCPFERDLKLFGRVIAHIPPMCKINLFIEPEVPGDPFEVSDAETMLNYINEKAGKPHRVFMFSKPGCPFCEKARKMLDDHGMSYEQVETGNGVSTKALYAVSGAGTTPQVFIDGRLVGGSEDLEAYFQKLDQAAA